MIDCRIDNSVLCIVIVCRFEGAGCSWGHRRWGASGCCVASGLPRLRFRHFVLAKCEKTISVTSMKILGIKKGGVIQRVTEESDMSVNISPCVTTVLNYCYPGWRKGFTASSHQPVGQHWQWQGICGYGGSRVFFWWISWMNCKEDEARCEAKLRFLSFESNAK